MSIAARTPHRHHDPGRHHRPHRVLATAAFVDYDSAYATQVEVDAYLAALEAERLRAEEAARVAVIVARWTAVGRCEQPLPNGGIQWTLQSSTYSGGLGISNAAWTAWGGLSYASNAGLATPWQQMMVAETIYSRYGASAWGCPIPG